MTTTTVGSHFIPPAVEKNLQGLHASVAHSFLPWRHVSENDVTILLSSSTAVSAKRSLLRSLLQLDFHYPVNIGNSTAEAVANDPKNFQSDSFSNERRHAVLLELFFNFLHFAQTQKWSPLKTSTAFSIVLSTHEYACQPYSPVNSPLPSSATSPPSSSSVALNGGPPPFSSVYAHFETLLFRHCIERPPFSVCVFSLPDVQAFSAFFLTHYLRVLKLYQFTFFVFHSFSLRVAHGLTQSVDAAAVQPLDEARNVLEKRGYRAHAEQEEEEKEEDEEDKAEDGSANASAIAEHGADSAYSALFESDASAKSSLFSAITSASTTATTAAAAVTASGNLSTDQRVAVELDRLQREFERRLKWQEDNFQKKVADMLEGKERNVIIEGTAGKDSDKGGSSDRLAMKRARSRAANK